MEDRTLKTKILGLHFDNLTREEAAAEALLRTLNEDQKALFLTYENARSESAVIAGDDYARQAFLLAREIFR